MQIPVNIVLTKKYCVLLSGLVFVSYSCANYLVANVSVEFVLLRLPANTVSDGIVCAIIWNIVQVTCKLSLKE